MMLGVKSTLTNAELAEGKARAQILADAIGSLAGVTRADILGHFRYRKVSAARQQLYADLWKDGYGIADIGRIVGRHHTTIMFGLRRALGDKEYEREIAARYPRMRAA